MAKKYIGDIVQTDVFKVKTNKPLDDRLVVTTRASLMEASTWQVVQGGDVKLYSGIVVNVVNDTDANNGLYSLRNWSKYNKQAWDSSDAQTYDADGWKKESAVQSDWDQTDTTANDYIKNKPTIPSAVTLRTMNHEQLTDSSLGDINIHDGYYFPNAVRDNSGNWYGAVVIGDQVWMAENYRSTKLPNGTQIVNASASANGGTKLVSQSVPYYYWFNDSESTAIEQGLLYNVSALMNGDSDSTSNPSGVQGIAPNGWHIPSNAEFTQLASYVNKQQRFLSNQLIWMGEAFNDYDTFSLHSKSVFTSSDIASLTQNEANSINATGFNLKSGYGATFFLTTDEHSSQVAVEEYSTGCEINFLHVGTNNGVNITKAAASIHTDYRSITLIDDTNNIDIEEGPNTSGASIRCVSDLSPVQFRNWYVETYGSMQHHLLPTYTYYSHICTNASEPLIMSCPDNEITQHDIGIDPNLSTAPSITINLCNTNDNCFTFMQGFTPSYYPVTLQYKGTAINQVVNFGGNSTGIFKDTNDDLYLYTKGRSMVFKLRVVTASTPYVLIESGEIDSTILNSNS